MNEGNNHLICIVLCAEKNDAVVRYTLPETIVSNYKAYLPAEEEPKRELRLDAFCKLEK